MILVSSGVHFPHLFYLVIFSNMAHSISAGDLDVGDIGVEGSDLPPFDQGFLPLCDWFGNAPGVPMELEVGSGKGTFLVQQAEQTPNVNYIGIEYARAYWRHAADRCRRHSLTNVKLIHTEAAFFIRNYVPNACMRQVHVYFPDPWPKKRHNKRRFIQADQLREIHRILEPSGQLRLATDHTDYFEWMCEHAEQVVDLFERLPFESPQSAGEGELVGTNFERKYRREGRPFNAMILKKR